MYKFFPHTASDIKEMLATIGVDSIEELFSAIPQHLKKPNEIDIPEQMSELELKARVHELAAKNKPLICFAGAGSYDVFDFSVCRALTSRQEFLTSYTPYQPEVSQGTLQYIFEFQSMICELTGMDVANASMYDGATAAAEAIFMALGQARKSRALVSKTLNPRVKDVIATYAKYRDVEIKWIDENNYATAIASFNTLFDDSVGAVLLSQPNYYGIIEDLAEIASKIDHQKSFLIMYVDPSTLPLLKTPQEWGADIVCGEGQTLGVPMSFGGPYVGFLGCTSKLVRRMPGRICGLTNDVDGKRGFVLTLQAREQHIRRDKANSNICSNQSLMALYVVIYMSLLGPKGLQEIANRGYQNAHYLEQQLTHLKCFKNPSKLPFFKEFVLQFDGDAHQLHQYLVDKGYLGGVVLDKSHILLCASEKRTKEEIDDFVRIVGEYHV